MRTASLRNRFSARPLIYAWPLTTAALAFACGVAGANPDLTSTAEFERLLDRGVPVVDVRTRSEWEQTGVIEGAHLLTFFDEAGRYDWNDWIARLQQIASKDEPVILMCHSGVRSAAVAKVLSGKAGYAAVYDYGPGIQGWLKEKRATVPPPQN